MTSHPSAGPFHARWYRTCRLQAYPCPWIHLVTPLMFLLPRRSRSLLGLGSVAPVMAGALAGLSCSGSGPHELLAVLLARFLALITRLGILVRFAPPRTGPSHPRFVGSTSCSMRLKWYLSLSKCSQIVSAASGLKTICLRRHPRLRFASPRFERMPQFRPVLPTRLVPASA